MITEYNKKSLTLGISGILFQIGCPLMMMAIGPGSPSWVGLSLVAGMFAGFILVIIGLCYYAAAKGYTAVLGVLGLFSCLGLLILALLPDRAKD
jgi:hypothetical protein